MRKLTLVLVLILGLATQAYAGPERRDVDGKFMFVMMQSTNKIPNIYTLGWYLCAEEGNETLCEVIHDVNSFLKTQGDEVCWDGGFGREMFLTGGRPYYRIILGGPRIHEDPHYLPLMRQEVVELSNLMRYPVPVVEEGVEDILNYCPDTPANLRWIAFDMDQDPEYNWENMCGYASPNYYYYPDLNILGLPTFVFGWDTHVEASDTKCKFVSVGMHRDFPGWIEFADTLFEEAFGGPPMGGGQDLAMLAKLWPWSVYADRGSWFNGNYFGTDDASTQTGNPRVELEPIDREVHATYWRMVDWWLDRYHKGEVNDDEVVRWASMRAYDYWNAVYHEKNYFGEEFAEVYNSNDRFCPAWTEGDLGSEFKIHLSRVLVPDPWKPITNQEPVVQAYQADLHCKWLGGDLWCQVETLTPTDNDWSCIATMFQPLPYPRLHVQRLGLNGWHGALAEDLDQATVYADFDYVGVIGGKHTFRLDRYGKLEPVPTPPPDMLEACADIGREVCGELQNCIRLVDPGVVSDPEPLPDYCPQNRYEGPDLYEHECYFSVDIYGQCTCYGGKCPPGN